MRACYVIVVTHARVPHGIYWLSSDVGPGAPHVLYMESEFKAREIGCGESHSNSKHPAQFVPIANNYNYVCPFSENSIYIVSYFLAEVVLAIVGLYNYNFASRRSRTRDTYGKVTVCVCVCVCACASVCMSVPAVTAQRLQCDEI